MASVNKVIIVGNLGRDPEVRTFPSGDRVANVTVATTDTDFLLQAARPLPQLHGRRVAGQQLAHRGRRQRLGTAH